MPYGALQTLRPFLNRRSTSASTCTASSRLQPKTSAQRQRASKGFFGRNSDAFRTSNLLLKEAYEAHRDDQTVALKRRLWQDLLQVALGKDAAAKPATKATGCSSGTPTSPA